MASNACDVKSCRPLKSIEELISFRQYCCPFVTAQENSSENSFKEPLPERPRILLCHDFAGGYLEDRYYCSEELAVQRKTEGEYNPAKDYCFDYWNRIDIFVYFSHHFVTVPPCKWISQGHSNGVKVLGTIIIEWNSELLKKILMPLARIGVIEALSDLCVSGSFDGWLLNMEVSVSKNYIGELRNFVSQLKSALSEKVPGSLVLWYDSVTTSGAINYQNALTNDNKAFFDDCDGIFLNYGWNNRSLDKSKKLAKDRVYDVFAGIDVFARNTAYKGGFNTADVVENVTKQGLSAAIFAPGWVLECNEPENFTENQEKFWGKLPVLR